jgi:cation:H+ antiporter
MTCVTTALRTWWQRRLLAAGSSTLAGVLAAVTGGHLPAVITIAALGAGMLGASLLLAWAADAAEVDLSGRIVIMAVALAAVLPELTVELQLAVTRQAEYVTANITGATRLLLTAALGLPAFGVLLTRSKRGGAAPEQAVTPARRLDLAVLGLAALGALAVAAWGKLTVVEGAGFGALYLVYALGGRDTDDHQQAGTGVAAQIASLRSTTRRRLCAVMFTGAVLAVLVIARTFPEQLLSAGRATGADSYLLIQFIIPIFTETPELTVAATLVRNRSPAQGISLLLASSVIQSTLVMMAIPGAYLVGGGGPVLALTGRERVEVLLTAATILLSVAALATLRAEPIDGWILMAAFGAETIIPAWQCRLAVALILLVFAADLFVSRRRYLIAMATALPTPARLLHRKG